jgi:hypothetical protein
MPQNRRLGEGGHIVFVLSVILKFFHSGMPKNFNHDYNFWMVRLGLWYFTWYFLWQDLSVDTNRFYLVTLTLMLLIENFNVGCIFSVVYTEMFSICIMKVVVQKLSLVGCIITSLIFSPVSDFIYWSIYLIVLKEIPAWRWATTLFKTCSGVLPLCHKE